MSGQQQEVEPPPIAADAPPRRYLSYKQAAEYLAVPAGTLRSLVSHKKIPHVRIGPRSVTFEVAELDRWVEQHRVEQREAAP